MVKGNYKIVYLTEFGLVLIADVFNMHQNSDALKYRNR